MDRRPHLPPRPAGSRATSTGSRTSTRSPRSRSSAPPTSRRAPKNIVTSPTTATIPGHPARRGSARVLRRARPGDAEVPRAGSRPPAPRPAQDARHRPRPQPRERAPERRHAARAARRGHAGARQGHVRRARPLHAGTSPSTTATSIADLGSVGHELHPARDRRQARRRRTAGEHRHIPGRLLDDTKAPLTGSNQYVLHIPKRSLPIPVKAFWSLTMYDSSSFFVPNPLNRYLINNRSHLHTNPDGSIDIYVQHDKPSNPAQVEQLAARTRHRASASGWSGGCTTSTTPSSACSTAPAGSHRRCSPATPPATRPTGPPARPSPPAARSSAQTARHRRVLCASQRSTA